MQGIGLNLHVSSALTFQNYWMLPPYRLFFWEFISSTSHLIALFLISTFFMISSKQHSMNRTRPNLMEWAEVYDFEKHVVQHTLELEIYSLNSHVRQDSDLSCSVCWRSLCWRRILCWKEEACCDSLNKSVQEFQERAKGDEFSAKYLLSEPYAAEILPHIKDQLNIALSFSTENQSVWRKHIPFCLACLSAVP